jgi:hypothetical protein
VIRPLRAVTIAVLTALGAGCATTVVEDTDATTGEPVTIVTVELGGSRDQLLTQLDAELQALSERIIEGDGDEDARARIDALWATLQSDLAADHPELLPGFQAVVDLAGNAVTRRRPADADKARLNAEALIAAAG